MLQTENNSSRQQVPKNPNNNSIFSFLWEHLTWQRTLVLQENNKAAMYHANVTVSYHSDMSDERLHAVTYIGCVYDTISVGMLYVTCMCCAGASVFASAFN